MLPTTSDGPPRSRRSEKEQGPRVQFSRSRPLRRPSSPTSSGRRDRAKTRAVGVKRVEVDTDLCGRGHQRGPTTLVLYSTTVHSRTCRCDDLRGLLARFLVYTVVWFDVPCLSFTESLFLVRPYGASSSSEVPLPASTSHPSFRKHVHPLTTPTLRFSPRRPVSGSVSACRGSFAGPT